MYGGQVFIVLFEVKQSRDIDAEFHQLLKEARIPPEQEHGGSCGWQRYVVVACGLSGLATLVNRILITDC
jgi:hypothetical protein